MNYNNYSLSAGKGKLYLKEKTPTQGYEEITYGTEGKKTYHKYENSIKGIPTFFGTKEVQYDGKTLRFLEFTLVDGDVSNKLSVPLKNKGGYTDEVKALLSAMSGLDLGEEITLTPTSSVSTGKNGKEYKNLNIYINYVKRLGENGKGLSTGYIDFNDIPKPVSKVVAGDTTWDWEAQTVFYWEKLTEIENRFKGTTSSTSQDSTPTQEKKPVTATPAQAFELTSDFVEEEEDDDLPF
jgi:membrane-associated protease RseP (regulator of RpoE activity)